MKQDDLRYVKCELECLAPVHIGSGETLQNLEYLYDETEQELYFIDRTKWMRFLTENRLVDRFVNFYAGYNSRTTKDKKRDGGLWKWLKDMGTPPAKIKSLAVRHAHVEKYDNGKKPPEVYDVCPLITQGNGQPFIPGSSIKGALRTAILYGLISKHKDEYAPFWQKILDAQKEPRGKVTFKSRLEDVAKELEKAAFVRLPFDVDDDMVRSVLRGLSVSDAFPKQSIKETAILRKVDMNKKWKKVTWPNGRTVTQCMHEIPLSRECLPVETKFSFTMTLDLRMLRRIGISSSEDIWDAVHRFAKSNWQRQKKVFLNTYGDEPAPPDALGEKKPGKMLGAIFSELEEESSKRRKAHGAMTFLGGGTGFLMKSMIYALAPTDEAARNVVADYLDTEFTKPSHHHVLEDDKMLSPRVLKLAMALPDFWLLGVCALREVSSC